MTKIKEKRIIIKKARRKILLRIELDKQIKEKAMREKKAYLENEKYKELFNENNKKMIKLEEESNIKRDESFSFSVFIFLRIFLGFMQKF